jgi:hypothetical protein
MSEMKPIKFTWTQTRDPHLASLVKTDPEFAERVRKSITSLEDWLEKCADKGNWDEIGMSIPYNQFVNNEILINDVGNENRMFLFVVLNSKPIEEIMNSVVTEHHTHLAYLDLMDSIKG